MNQPPQQPGNQPPQPQQPGNQPPQQPGNFPPPGNYPPPPGNFPPPPQGPGGYGPPGNFPPPPGNYPPPPGNYGPPPGNFPPPPPGYYPPPPGYPASSGSPLSIGDGFSWAWKQFSKNLVPLLVSTLVYGLIIGALSGALYGILAAVSPDTVTNYYSDTGSFSYSANMTMGPVGTIISFLGSLVILVVAGAISSAYIGGLLDIADGRPVSVGSFFKPRKVVGVVVVTLIIGILTAIGNFLCFVPGLLVSIFTMFAIVALIDRNLSPIDALKASFELVKANFLQALLVWLIAVAIAVVGALLCGVGLLVAVPVSFLFELYAYRRLSGGNVAPAA